MIVTPNHQLAQPRAPRSFHHERGFSLIELIIVIALMIIMTLIGVSALVRTRELGVTDDQALRILDLMRQARQLAITRHRVVRFEIDPQERPVGVMRIIDTVGLGTGDDVLVTEMPFITAPVAAVVDQPSPVGLPYPTAAVPDTYPEIATKFNQPPHPLLGSGNPVWAATFVHNGMMVDPATATNTAVPVPVMATIVVQNPTQPNTTLRAITLFGGSSSAKIWKYAGAGATVCSNGQPDQNDWCN